MACPLESVQILSEDSGRREGSRMAGRRYIVEQIIGKPERYEVALAQSQPLAAVAWNLGTSG